MKKFSILALALALPFSASAEIICYNQNPATLVVIENGETYAHTSKDGELLILGQDGSHFDVQINSLLKEGETEETKDSVLNLSINNEQIKIPVTCFDNKD